MVISCQKPGSSMDGSHARCGRFSITNALPAKVQMGLLCQQGSLRTETVWRQGKRQREGLWKAGSSLPVGNGAPGRCDASSLPMEKAPVRQPPWSPHKWRAPWSLAGGIASTGICEMLVPCRVVFPTPPPFFFLFPLFCRNRACAFKPVLHILVLTAQINMSDAMILAGDRPFDPISAICLLD